jgi:hypothetical protein
MVALRNYGFGVVSAICIHDWNWRIRHRLTLWLVNGGAKSQPPLRALLQPLPMEAAMKVPLPVLVGAAAKETARPEWVEAVAKGRRVQSG